MESEVFLTFLNFTLIDDPAQILVSDRQSLHGGVDLGNAGSNYIIVGLDQNIVVIVEAERILDGSLGGVEVDRAERRIFFGHSPHTVRDGTGSGYREHCVEIEDVALIGIILVSQRENSVGVVLSAVQRSDAAVLISGGVQRGVYGKAIAYVEFLCLGSAVQRIDGDNCFVACGLSGLFGSGGRLVRMRAGDFKSAPEVGSLVGQLFAGTVIEIFRSVVDSLEQLGHLVGDGRGAGLINREGHVDQRIAVSVVQKTSADVDIIIIDGTGLICTPYSILEAREVVIPDLPDDGEVVIVEVCHSVNAVDIPVGSR